MLKVAPGPPLRLADAGAIPDSNEVKEGFVGRNCPRLYGYVFRSNPPAVGRCPKRK